MSTAPAEMTIEDLVAQVRKIQGAIQAVMIENEHYGAIPGTSPRKGPDGKPLPPKMVLLKPGAEKLCLLFRLAPDYVIQNRVDDPGFIYREVKCILTHIPTGNIMGAGIGSCSSREEKYGFRRAQRSCPKCGKEAILKSRNEGEGYFYWKKKDGCGATFPLGDASIEKQEVGKVANENIWDSENTISKMAQKRALVAAVLNATAASDSFTQDVEDLPAPSVGGGGSSPSDASRAGAPPAGGRKDQGAVTNAGGSRPVAAGAQAGSTPVPSTPPAHNPTTGEVRPSERAQHVKIFAKANDAGMKTPTGAGDKGQVYAFIQKHLGFAPTGADGKPSIKVLSYEQAERLYVLLCNLVGHAGPPGPPEPPPPSDADAPIT
jgi:hypothetical protein